MAKKQVSTGGSGAAFTDTRRVEELVALMAANGLTEIELVEDKSRIVLRRGGHSGGGGAPAAMAPAHTHVMPTAHSPIAAPPVAAAPADENAGLVAIKSIMVGTFYSAPSPESDPYVSIGSHVDEKTVVCTIEAMKVFNEIQAEVRGTIAKVMVSNGQAVEYGQPLFMVKPG